MPQEYMERTTHRWHGVLLAWLEMDMNYPDKLCSYLMQVACEVRRVLRKNPNEVKLKDFQLKFGKDEASAIKSSRTVTIEQEAAFAKAKWGLALAGVRQEAEERKQMGTNPTKSSQTMPRSSSASSKP